VLSEQINHNATVSTFLASSDELLTAALAAVLLWDVVAVTAGGLAAEADGGRPTGRTADAGLVGCLAATVDCFAVAAARDLSAAGGFSVVGFTAGVLVRSFFGDTGGELLTLFTGSGADYRK